MKNIILVILIFSTTFAFSNESLIKLARVKYSGGGDWYNDRSSEVNLLEFIDKNTNIPVDPVYEFVDLKSDNLFLYPLIFLTGHGNINFTDTEAKNLRNYLLNGGFLYIDDDYGLDEYIQEEIKKVFPDNEFKEIPFSHDIFNIHYKFPNGAPKIHEHDDKPPKTMGIFVEDQLVCVYTLESNPSDGWADPEVHDNPPEKRREALEFGTNIIVWALR